MNIENVGGESDARDLFERLVLLTQVEPVQVSELQRFRALPWIDFRDNHQALWLRKSQRTQ
jgi:hypothetical protein